MLASISLSLQKYTKASLFFERLKTMKGQTLLTFSGMIFVQLCNFIFIIILSHAISPSDLGKYQIVWGFVVLLSFFAKLGMDQGLPYYLPKILQKDRGKVLGIIGSALLLGLVFSVGVSLCIIMASGHIGTFYEKIEGMGGLLETVIYLLPPYILLLLASSGLRGLDRSDLRAYISYFGVSIFLVAGIFILSKHNLNIEMALHLRGGVLTLCALFTVFVIIKISKGCYSFPTLFDLKHLFRLSGLLFFVGIFQYLSEQPFVGLSIVGKICSPHHVGLFGVAARVGALVLLPLAATQIVLAPIFVKNISNSNVEETINIFKKALNFMVFFTFAIMIIFLSTSEIVLTLFGEEYIEANNILRIFITGYTLVSIFGLFVPLNIALGYEKFELLMGVGSLAVMTLGGIILGLLFGPEGVAVATTCSLLIFALIRLIVIRKRMDMGVLIGCKAKLVLCLTFIITGLVLVDSLRLKF